MIKSNHHEQLNNDFTRYKALWGLDTNDYIEDVKVRYLDEVDLTRENILELCDVANGIMLIIGFASPECDVESIGELIKSYIPQNVKFFILSTAGEISSGDVGQSLYKPNIIGRKKIVLQSFSKRMFQDCQIITFKLPNDDLKNNQIIMTSNKRIEKLKEELCRIELNFPIKSEDTVALAYVDILSKCEAFVMQAIYASKRFPCVVVGGSVGNLIESSSANIYDGHKVLQNCGLICLIKMKPQYKFGILKSQALERGKNSFKIADANHTMRYVSKVIDDNLQFVNFIDYLKNVFKCNNIEQLEKTLLDYSFAIEINGELFARSVKRIDSENGRVYFYSDVGIGEKFIIIKRVSLLDSLRCDWERFMKNKPKPIAGIVIDCITRRLINSDNLDKIDLFKNVKIAGFLSFGELLGVPINETLTAIFFFKVGDSTVFQDKYHDYFPVFYGEFTNYFLLRRLKQIQIVGELENKILERFKLSNDSLLVKENDSIDGIDKNFVKIFANDFLDVSSTNENFGNEKILKAINSVKPRLEKNEENSVNDIGILVSYMQMMLDNLSTQKDNLEKTVLMLKKSIYKYAKDELTNVYTRRAGYELIHNLMKTKAKGVNSLIFVFIDINDLKYANDLVGHEEGDYYLKTTIELIKPRLSDIDFICRYGGDEFIIVFPNGVVEDVESMLNDVNKKLAKIEKNKQKPYSMSFSFGIFVYKYGDNLSLEDILRSIDDQMYQYKCDKKSLS